MGGGHCLVVNTYEEWKEEEIKTNKAIECVMMIVVIMNDSLLIFGYCQKRLSL